MEGFWLAKVKKLHAIAETGLAFAKDDYDIERYEEIAALARDMLSNLTSIPVNQLKHLLTTDVRRYVSPQIDVRGAVFHQDKILLVQEKTDGRWTLPGGYADLGLSAAENIEKEVHEEAGIKVRAQTLFAVRHKAKGQYDEDVRDFYKLFFICQATNGVNIKTGSETSDVGFFGASSIPKLSSGRIILRDIENAFAAKHAEHFCPLFD